MELRPSQIDQHSNILLTGGPLKGIDTNQFDLQIFNDAEAELKKITRSWICLKKLFYPL